MGLQQLRPADAHQLPARQCSYLCTAGAQLIKCKIIVTIYVLSHLVRMLSHRIVTITEVKMAQGVPLDAAQTRDTHVQ